MFGKRVFSPVELLRAMRWKWEMYTKKIQIEARVLGDLAINHVIPVATRYQSLLLDNVFKIKSLFSSESGRPLPRRIWWLSGKYFRAYSRDT